MNYKILLLAASALLMGACGGQSDDVADSATPETTTPDYVYGEQEGDAATEDMIDGDGSETLNDNAVVDTRVDTGPANLDEPEGMPMPEDDMTGDPAMEQDGSPETVDETTPQ